MKVALLMLNKLGYKADVVSNWEEAVQALSHKHYDVVLMDVQMLRWMAWRRQGYIGYRSSDRPRILAMTAYARGGSEEMSGRPA